MTMGGYLKKQLTIASCLYIGEISAGYLAWSSPVIAKLLDPDQTPLAGVISESQGSWIGASSMPGILVGALTAGWVSNTFGRKPCLLFGGVLTMACYVLLATADHFWMIVAGRALNGVGASIIYVTNTIYIAEMSSTNIRGMLLTAPGVFTSVGVLVAFVVGPFFSYVRVMYMGFCLAMISSIGILFIPETPSFYVLKGKEIEAKTTLVALGRSEDIEEVLSSKLHRSTSTTQGLKDVFVVSTNRKAFMISLVLFVCQGLSGYLSVMFYMTPIFQSVNSSIDPGLATIIVGATQVLASCVTPLFVERKGRKILLIFSTAGCSLSLGILGFYFLLQKAGHASATQLHWVPLVAVVVFLISYPSGFCTIPGACANEMFDCSARGPGSSLLAGVGALVCFTASAGFGYLSSTVGSHVPFLIFAGAGAFCSAFSYIFVVETKGKSLAEVQLMLSK